MTLLKSMVHTLSLQLAPALVYSWPQPSAPSGFSLPTSATWGSETSTVGRLPILGQQRAPFFFPCFTKPGVCVAGGRSRRECGEVDYKLSVLLGSVRWQALLDQSTFTFLISYKKSSTLIYKKGPKFMVMTCARLFIEQTVKTHRRPNTNTQTKTHPRAMVFSRDSRPLKLNRGKLS